MSWALESYSCYEDNYYIAVHDVFIFLLLFTMFKIPTVLGY